MKWICLLVVSMAVIITACSFGKVDTNGLPIPDPELAAKAGISIDAMSDGYWVFTRKCLECHEARIPQVEMKGQWHPEVEGIAGNVGLSLSEESSLWMYVKAASRR